MEEHKKKVKVDGKEEVIGYTKVSNLLVRSMNWIPDTVKITLICLMSYAYGKKNWCNPSIPRIAKDRQVTKKTVHLHIKFLENKELIRIERKPGSRNKYIINDLFGFKADVLKYVNKYSTISCKEDMDKEEIKRAEEAMNDLYMKLGIKKRFKIRRVSEDE